MGIATQIMKRLEADEDCVIKASGWKSPGYGSLVEVGIPIRLGNIELEIMCSYENIFLKRISGNKDKFYNLCESIRGMDFDPT